MATGYLHINGTTYELAYPVADRDAWKKEASSRLMFEGPGVLRYEVKIEGQSVDLVVSTEGLNVMATWSTDVPDPQPRGTRFGWVN